MKIDFIINIEEGDIKRLRNIWRGTDLDKEITFKRFLECIIEDYVDELKRLGKR